MEEKMVKGNGVDICTQSFGDKNNPSILLIAGATVSMLFWDETFCRQLANKGFHVIRYDNRDVGKSTCYEPGTTPYNIVDMTDDAVAVLNGYAKAEAHVAGISLGGLIGQIAALRYPERVASLILMSTGPWGDTDPSVPEMDARILDFQARAGEVDWTNEDRVTEYLLEGDALMSGRKVFDRNRSEKRIREEFRRAGNYLSMFNHAALQGGEDYYNRIDDIRQPVLVIHGTDDLIWHFDHAKTLTRRINGAKLIELEGTGHELHSDDTDVIINGIASHINNYLSSGKKQ